jgi:hypothetical protein
MENDMSVANAHGETTNASQEKQGWMMDDDDDGLTEEQRRMIAERVAALQNRFKKFEEKTMKEKIDELMLANSDVQLTEREADMILKVCNGNEFEASDRLGEAEDGEAFLMSIRSMIAEEDALKRVGSSKSRAVQAANERLQRKIERMRKRRASFGLGDESEEELPEEEDLFHTEYILEESLGVQFVRHTKKHVGVRRLRLDDAIARVQEAAVAAAEEGAEAPADLYEGWSDARVKAWKNREKNENQYYYRFNAPGEKQSNGKWTDTEHELFMETIAALPDGKADYQWGTFSKAIPGRVGYQCSNYYRSLVKNGIIVDTNYMVDEKGELRFNFKNKGFDRVEQPEGSEQRVFVKVVRVPKPKAPKAPKPKPKKKKKLDDDDKAFQCSVRPTVVRSSGRAAKRSYADGEDEDDDGEFEELPVLPGFIDPITRLPVEEPTISPYGHVAGYETWCRILRSSDAPDVCPFTKQPLKRRELVKLTHENIGEYASKIVENQQM